MAGNRRARRGRQTWVVRFLVCCIAGVSLVLAGGVDTAQASCAGPRLMVSSGVVAPGSSISVRGSGFGTACNDTGQSGPPLGDAMQDIDVAFVQGADRVHLGTVDADSNYDAEFSVTVPAAATPGPAELDVGSVRLGIWIDGPPVAVDRSVPSTTPVTQFPSRDPIKVSRAGQFAIVAILAALAGAGAVVALRKLRERRT